MVLGSTNACGYMDLDTRPPEMERTDALYNVQECKTCGFVAYDLSSKTKIKKEYLNSVRYKECDQIEFVSKFSKMFYRMYLIKLEEENYQIAFWCLLRCSWSADDVSDDKNSIEIRKRCLELIDTFKINDHDVQLNLVKLDLLRRSKQFDECIEFIERLKKNSKVLNAIYKKSPKGLINKIINLQSKLCGDKDDKCYNIEGKLTKSGNPSWYLAHTHILKKQR